MSAIAKPLEDWCAKSRRTCAPRYVTSSSFCSRNGVSVPVEHCDKTGRELCATTVRSTHPLSSSTKPCGGEVIDVPRGHQRPA